MPFTPFHLGPGLAIKAIAGERFSLIAFGLAQVAMDIEPLLGMLRGAAVLHGPTHTYLGAALIAPGVAGLVPLLGSPLLRRWNRELACLGLDRWRAPEKWSPLPIALGAGLGTLSHVLLDSLMHTDIQPLAPWSAVNALWHLLPVSALHELCIASGGLGLLGWLGRGLRRQGA
ncbi:MAG: hypothetical protein RIR00_1932 [Pseudomonadota bacterium]|jgi:hypothetical protein